MSQELDAAVRPKDQMSYGHAASLLGLRAHDALYDLCDVPSEWSEGRQGYWLPSDKRALQGWFNIEEKIPGAQAEAEVNAAQAEHLEDLLFQYHVALPFDEAERYWLFDTYDEAWGLGSIGAIRRQEARIVSGGLQRVIYGRDLMR